MRGSDFIYQIDSSYGLSQDGYIATGTESIVYKGLKISKDRKIVMSCVLKFKYKHIRMSTKDNEEQGIDVLTRFKENDLKIFDKLQNCRSVVRIYDVIEDLGDFSLLDKHIPKGWQAIINRQRQIFLCSRRICRWMVIRRILQRCLLEINSYQRIAIWIKGKN